MRALPAILSSVALVACGGACPEPAAPTDADPEPTAARPVDDTMDGTWAVREIDDDDVEALIEIAGDGGRATRVGRRDRESYPVRVTRRDGEPARVAVETGRGAPDEVLWVPRGPGRALLFEPGNDELLVARRTQPVPEGMRGKWRFLRADTAVEGRFSFTADTVHITYGEEGGGGAAYGLEAEGDAVFLLVEDLLRRRGDSDELTELQLEPVGDGSYLMRLPGDDDFAVVYRPGARPSWLPEPRHPDRPPTPAVVVEPPPPMP